MTTTDTQSMIDYVQEMNVLGWATFPTHKKIPPKGSTWTKIEPNPFGVDPAQYNGQYALRLRPTDLVIDVDPRNFPKDRNCWKEFITEKGLPGLGLDTFVVITGSGGRHIYYKKPADVEIRKNLKEYPGIDFLGGEKSRYVIGPGSIHENGNMYRIRSGEADKIADAPTALLDILQRSADPEPVKTMPVEFSDDPQNIQRYREYLTNAAEPAVEGQAGDNTTFKVACRGRDFNLSQEKTFDLMVECYNERCLPPWPVDQLRVKVENAYKYNVEIAGKKDPSNVFSDKISTDTLKAIYDAEGPFDLDANSKMKKTLRNAVKLLITYPELTDILKYNEFSHDIEVTGKLPWHDRRAACKTWTDDDTTHLKLFLAKTHNGLEFATITICEAVLITASRNIYHPLRKYLVDLKWDGIPRLNKWLTTYCHAVSNPYVDTIGRKVLLAAVRRVFNPGAKFDHVLVLEGKQGIGKSRVVAALGGAFYGDMHIDPRNKDTVDALQGKWIIELSEMDAVRRKQDIQALKAFISRTDDRARLAYARMTKDFPRQCIFIGTVNPDSVGYLSDDTGNRRFWPVMCESIDVEAVQRDRDQLYAEAVQAHMAGEDLHITDPTVRTTAENEANARVELDPWFEIISEWTEGPGLNVDKITTTRLYELLLGGMAKNITRLEQMRIGKLLTTCGWVKIHGHGHNYYVKSLLTQNPGELN